jgi:hypothetical protein
MVSIRTILWMPFRAFSASLRAVCACIYVAWIVLRVLLAIALFGWLAIAVWLLWHDGRIDHFIAALAALSFFGWMIRGGGSNGLRIWIWYLPSHWHREGMRANFHQD